MGDKSAQPKNHGANMSHPSHVALSALSTDSANVRRTGRGAEPLFTASVKAKGIKLPFLVRPNGAGYKVVDGGKRHDALLWLLEQGETANGVRVTEAYPVPVLIEAMTDVEAREASLVTHTRAELHPIDRYEAIADLVADGKSRTEIGATYAMSDRELDQVLALGALSPTVRQAWRDDVIDAGTAKAFTLAPDHKTQDRIFKEFNKDGQGLIEEGDVKQRLKANENDAGAHVQFVGIDEYEKRGGKVTRDLFGVDHIVSNTKLAKAMAEEKLEAECARLVADGWAWALPKDSIKNDWNYGRTKVTGEPTAEEQAEHDKLDRIAENWDHPQHDQAKSALDRLDSAVALRAFTAAQKAKSGCFVSIGDDGELVADYGRTKPAEQKERSSAAERPKAEKKPTPTPAEKKKAEAAKLKAAETGEVSNSLARDLHTQLLRATKRALKAEAARFPKSGLASLLAAVAADLVEPDQSYNRALDDKVLVALRAVIDPKIMNEACEHEFDAKEYFARVPRHFAIAAVKESINEDEARKLDGKKSAEVTKFAVTNVPKAWLPHALRTPHYQGPAAAAKATKAKPKRKAA